MLTAQTTEAAINAGHLTTVSHSCHVQTPCYSVAVAAPADDDDADDADAAGEVHSQHHGDAVTRLTIWSAKAIILVPQRII